MKCSMVMFSLSVATIVYARSPPSICMFLSPTITLTAGQSLSATIENDQGRPCLTTLVFSNDQFLPMIFDLQPTACLGYQVAEIVVPTSVPNGNVSILWECAGDNNPACMLAEIEGGGDNSSALMQDRHTGTMKCLVPFVASSTLSTLTMTTGSNSGPTPDSTPETTPRLTPDSTPDNTPGLAKESATGSTTTTMSRSATISTSVDSAITSPIPTPTPFLAVDIQFTTAKALAATSSKCPCGQGSDTGSPFS